MHSALIYTHSIIFSATSKGYRHYHKMFLSRISLAFYTSSMIACCFHSTATAQNLRKSAISSPVKESNRDFSIFGGFFGKRHGKDNRSLSAMHYSQMGIDIDGPSKDYHLGKSVSISKDGLRVAIAAATTIESGDEGTTQVFDWDADIEEWVQVGQDIFGLPGLGWSMDMNDDGSRIVLGAPEARGGDGAVLIYELDDNEIWQQLANAILPPNNSDGHAGYSVTMNSVGDRVAIGAKRFNNDMGKVSAFELKNSTWQALGQDLETTYYDNFSAYYTKTQSGCSIAFDSSGSRLVVGGKLGSYLVGHVIIYDFDEESSKWNVNGQIDGDNYYDRFGHDVDISEDGNRIIVGASSSEVYAGQVSVYDYDGTSWTRIGQKIYGANDEDLMGSSVAISGDGTHIAFSSPKYDEKKDTNTNEGKVEVYTFSQASQSWERKEVIMGECEKDKFGDSEGALALDHSGAHLAVGTQQANYYAGMLRVYEALPGEGDGTNGSTNDCGRRK